jgi:diaminohydroxyphosphoribosylaminopyrimidine deaminase / 5-amino-6-(5-phosphoribosylamino)uracil reductase
VTNEPETLPANPLDWAANPGSASLCMALGEAQPGEDPYSPIIHAPSARPFLIAQLGQSLDGRIATPAGESQWINNAAALDHLHRVRSLVDAVAVGVRTVMLDDPMLTVRRVPGRNPARVVIDPSGRMPAGARCLADDGVRRLVVTAKDYTPGNGVEAVTLERTNGRIGCKEIVQALFSRGLKRVLIEGGASTISAFMEARAVDRLHVLVAPLILGSGKPGLEFSPAPCLADALRPKTRAYQLAGGDVLFDCDMRAAGD